jgi:hypothetical protein
MATTKTSIRLINTEKNSDAGANQILLKINMSDIKLNIIICPADMLANNLIIREIGLIKMPKNSIGARNNFIGTGMPGIQKICFQYSLLATTVVIINVIAARTNVNAMFPLKLALKGKKGISPITLLIQIKKNKVNKNGIYLW